MQTVLLGADHQSVLRRVLQERDHEVVVCEDADAAWTVLSQNRVDLVIMARADDAGVNLCRRLRQSHDGDLVTVIAILAPYSSEKLEAVLDADVDECIIESLDQPERLHARLAFAEKNVKGKQVRRGADVELKARLRQRASLAALGQFALQTASLASLAETVVETTADAMDVDLAKLLEVDLAGNQYMMRSAAGLAEISSEAHPAEPLPGTHIAHAVAERKPVIVPDIEAESRFTIPASVASMGMQSGALVVIEAGARPYGALSVYTRARRGFNQDDIYFLQAVANIVSAFIDRAAAQAALRESEARVRAILDTMVDGIITIDERGTIESFNVAAEKLFGYKADEVVGRNIKILMPEPYAREHDDYLEAYLSTGVRRIIGSGREVVGKRKDGSVFPMYLAVSEVFFNEKRIFTGIVRDITEPRRLEQEILRISDQERRRIGQDLHDGLGQMLTGIGLIARNTTRKLKDEGHRVGEDLQEITDLIREADEYARSLARNLVPVEVEANGLSAALRRLVVNAERLFGVSCKYKEAGPVLLEDNATAVHLYRIAQEALSNAAKHAKASKIEVSLIADNQHVTLSVEDDGIGFSNRIREERGMGIRIMHYRARLVGGSLDMSRPPSGGTVVTCLVPRQVIKTNVPAASA